VRQAQNYAGRFAGRLAVGTIARIRSDAVWPGCTFTFDIPTYCAVCVEVDVAEELQLTRMEYLHLRRGGGEYFSVDDYQLRGSLRATGASVAAAPVRGWGTTKKCAGIKSSRRPRAPGDWRIELGPDHPLSGRLRI